MTQLRISGRLLAMALAATPSFALAQAPVPAEVQAPAETPAETAAQAPAETPVQAPAEPPVTAPASPPASEAPAAEGPAVKTPPSPRAAEQGGLWRAFTQGAQGGAAPTASALEPLEKGSNEELQKKVNELVRLAHMNVEKNRIAEAIKSINELITLKPYDAEYHLALALSYRREGRFADAAKKYQDVLDLGGPKALIALLRAEAYAVESKPDKVFEHLKEAAVGGRNIINDVRLLPLLSGFQSDSDFVKLALQLENVTVSASRTHDPFTNPFPTNKPGVEANAKEGAENATSMSPEEQEKFLQEAKKTMERIQFYIKLDDETKAMKAYASIREMIRKKDLLTVPRIINEFRILILRLDTVEIEIQGIRLKYYYNLAQAKLKQMKESFADGEYAQVEAIHSELTRLAQEMEGANANYKPVAEQIMAHSQKWVQRAQVRQDFESRKPNIQGIVISETNKMAVLNDRIVKQGESVDDIRVVKVESNRVTFRYKGEEIPLVFRRY